MSQGIASVSPESLRPKVPDFYYICTKFVLFLYLNCMFLYRFWPEFHSDP